MRRYLVFALLSLMVFSLVMSLATRPRASHRVPVARATTSRRPASARGSAARAAAGTASGTAAGTATAHSRDNGAGKHAAPAKVTPIARPLRVVCLRWAPCAPAIVAAGGTRTVAGSAYRARGLDVRVGARPSMRAIEHALGAGGAKADGADVAIVPLPELVAAHERLRALAPRVFLVTAWSRGDLALIARTPALGRAALRPYGLRRVTLSGAPGRPATLLALFALDLSGVSLDRVVLVAARSHTAALYARSGLHVRGLPRQRLLLTSADARRLVPYVAVAARGVVTARARALVRFADGWFAGARRAAADVPAAARALSAVDRTDHDSARRSASALIADLGAIAPASLLQNARGFGLSGRPPLTVDWLYRKTHELWRRTGQLAEQTPLRAPVHAEIIARLFRERPTSALASPSDGRDAQRSDQPGLRFSASGATHRALLLHRSRTHSSRALADRLAIVAAIFDSSRIELRVDRGRRAARRVLRRAERRFDIVGARGRLVAGTRTSSVAATIAVTALAR